MCFLWFVSSTITSNELVSNNTMMSLLSDDDLTLPAVLSTLHKKWSLHVVQNETDSHVLLMLLKCWCEKTEVTDNTLLHPAGCTTAWQADVNTLICLSCDIMKRFGADVRRHVSGASVFHHSFTSSTNVSGLNAAVSMSVSLRGHVIRGQVRTHFLNVVFFLLDSVIESVSYSRVQQTSNTNMFWTWWNFLLVTDEVCSSPVCLCLLLFNNTSHKCCVRTPLGFNTRRCFSSRVLLRWSWPATCWTSSSGSAGPWRPCRRWSRWAGPGRRWELTPWWSAPSGRRRPGSTGTCHGHFWNCKHKIIQLSSGKFILYICRWAKCHYTEQRTHEKHWHVYHTPPRPHRGGGGEREDLPQYLSIFSNSLMSVPGPLVWPLSRSSPVSPPLSCLHSKESCTHRPLAHGWPLIRPFDLQQTLPWPTVLNTGHSHLNISSEYTSVFSHHYTLM